MQDFFSSRRVVVTGGAGFLGKHLVQQLQTRGCTFLVVPRRATCDLRKWESVCRLLDEAQPHLVIHLAGLVTGIGGLCANPAGSFYDNLIMGVQLIEAARQRNIEKLVVLGTVCSYPESVPIPAREEDIWNGYPEETNAPYGMAKKVLLVQCQAYRQQYGLNSVVLIPANLYGPGDNFDPDTSHVIPALIRRFSEAARKGDREVVCWGDGTPTREFLYVKDCAEAVLLAAELYNESQPVNLGTGIEISIGDLAHEIARFVGFKGRIVWDTSKPNGQPRRCWDVARAEKAFGFRARTNLAKGLARTITWYRQNFSRKGQHEQSHVGLLKH